MEKEEMIPKIIHYCWFGGKPLPDEVKRYIASWRKHCPDYEIKEWNERNFDCNANQYVKEAYEAKKWAFVTDYVRLYALYHEGGIYMDTDVELLKNLDPYLGHAAFSGFENDTFIPTAIMGSVKHGVWMEYLLSYYDNRHFINPDGSFDQTTNVLTITSMTQEKYQIRLDNTYQEIEGVAALYPKEYFCPKSYETGEIMRTDNTVCIHHFRASWHDKRDILQRKKRSRYIEKYGADRGAIKYQKWARRNFIRLAMMQLGIKGFAYKVLHKIKTVIYKILLVAWRGIINKVIKVGNTLFFETEGDFCDNGRAFYEFLIDNGYNNRYKIVWKVSDAKRFKKFQCKNVMFLSDKGLLSTLKMEYYIGRAKYLFFTHPWWLTEWKKDQVVINFCHGIPFKGAGRNLSNTFNYACVSSETVKNLIQRFMGKEIKSEQFLILGAPRLDLLLKKTDIKPKLSKYISNNTYQKMVLCMPTFRQSKYWTDGSFINTYSINSIKNEDELRILNQFLAKKGILLVVKIHHLQRLNFLDKSVLSNIIYLTDDNLLEIDLQLYELVGCSDALLTDYSSIFFDYLLLDRPIGFFIGDMEEYSRGFIMDNPLDYMPGDKIVDNDQLYDFLNRLLENEDKYHKQRKRILDMMDIYQDNQNCKRIAEYLNL